MATKCNESCAFMNELSGLCDIDDHYNPCDECDREGHSAMACTMEHIRGSVTVGKMICTKEARRKCELAYMCEENAEVADDSECADLIVRMEAAKWTGGREMSRIVLADMAEDTMLRIRQAQVYDLYESIAASKYPMQTVTDPTDDELTETAVKLAQSPAGEGHDNWLLGVRVAFDIRLTAKALVEAERYHFFDIVSSTSTMHRITGFDLNGAYCEYVDQRMIAVMTELVCEYNEQPTPEKYLRILYSNPAGFTYTMRITTNYRQLKTIYRQRRAHRLPEWREFCKWIECLPEAKLITGGQ